MSENNFEEFINAIERGDEETVQTLCRDEWIDKANNDRKRPIDLACYNGCVPIVRFLLDKTCQIEAADQGGWRPIHWACVNGHVDVVQLLADRSCDIEAADEHGWRPIHMACANGDADIVQFLLDRGCQMEAAADDGLRPIHFASRWGHSKVVQILLDRGGIIDAQTEEGKTPLDLAKENKKDECARMIEKAEEKRRTTEFSIWHCKEFIVIWRQFAIYDVVPVTEFIKRNVLQIGKPVLLCDRSGFDAEMHRQTNATVIRLTSDELSYPEYVVVERSDTIADVVQMLNSCRCWDVSLFYPDGNAEVPLELSVDEFMSTHSCLALKFKNIQSDGFQMEWRDHLLMSVKFPDDKEAYATTCLLSQLHVLCLGNKTLRRVKHSVIEFIAMNISLMIGDELDCQTKDMDRVTYLLKRLVMNRMEFLTFWYRGKGLGNSETLVNAGLVDNSSVDVVHKWKQDIDFIPQLNNACSWDCVLRFFCQRNFIVVKSVVETYPIVAVLRSHCSTVRVLKDAIMNKLDVQGRLLIMCNDDILGDDKYIRNAASVFDYAVICRYVGVIGRERIGGGSFGKVYKCEYKEKVCAIKKIDMHETDLWKEVVCVAKVPPHERVMKYDEIFEEMLEVDKYLCLCMAFMEGGSLGRYLTERKKMGEFLQEKEIVLFCRQILEGLHHLHTHNILHRDVKGLNVLLDKDRVNVKLCDFGLSKFLSNLPASRPDQICDISQKGTGRYMAPELLDDQSPKFSTKSDVWSFGVTVVEMITGAPPHGNLGTARVTRDVRKEKTMKYTPQQPLSDEMKMFVDRCLQGNPQERPTCEELLSLPPIEPHGVQSLTSRQLSSLSQE